MEALTSSALQWGIAGFTLGGERDSGDRGVVAPFGGGVLFAALDGLGHGEEAASAAQIAATILSSHPQESVLTLVQRCHEQLRTTRGVVMSLAAFNAHDETMTWLGVGNVEGRLVRGKRDAAPSCEFLLLRGGVVGSRLPPLHAAVVPVAPGDTLLFVTDGADVPPVQEVAAPGQPPQALADRILARYKKETDDALVLLARWAGPVS